MQSNIVVKYIDVNSYFEHNVCLKHQCLPQNNNVKRNHNFSLARSNYLQYCLILFQKNIVFNGTNAYIQNTLQLESFTSTSLPHPPNIFVIHHPKTECKMWDQGQEGQG